MSLGTALNLILEDYQSATEANFGGNAVAEMVRRELPALVEAIIGKNDRYLVSGSAGKGNWALVPWVAVFDRLVTESAQDGYYLVYLFRQDSKGLYLSLNQGVTSVRDQYGSDSKHALRVKSVDYLARLGKLADGLAAGKIDLAVASNTGLGSLYENGSVCSIYYDKSSIPNDEKLSADLRRFLDLYLTLVSRQPRLFGQADAEEDESELGEEDLRALREHKRIERNRKLSAQAKKHHGFVCKACGFDFKMKYGQIGSGFIEAHHLTPLALLKGLKVSLDPKTDFTVLCSNCHRMIHKTEFVNKVEEFRANYVVDKIG